VELFAKPEARLLDRFDSSKLSWSSGEGIDPSDLWDNKELRNFYDLHSCFEGEVINKNLEKSGKEKLKFE